MAEHTGPTLPPSPSDPLPGPEPSRRLTRSSSDKYLAGVAGGLGRFFGVDPILFRIAFGISVFFGGLGVLAYVALLAFVPADDGEPSWMEGRSRATTIGLTVVLAIAAVSLLAPPAFILGPGLFGVAALSVLGLVLYRAFGGASGDDPARAIARATLVLLVLVAALGAGTGVGFVAAIGGGPAIAVLSILAGVGLIAAGLLGGPRWLILPVIVLVLPLAVVSAADIDLRGGVGQRDYRPATLADLRPEYRIGVGQVDLDLRDVTLPAGRTEVRLKVGVGEARVRVPDGACVSTDAQIGAGAADLPERADQGLDIAVDQSAPSVARHPQLLVTADVGVGHLQIDRDDLGSGAGGCA
jgi:phage shock protein PspC (stress-responsive transcriptional regulator)